MADRKLRDFGEYIPFSRKEAAMVYKDLSTYLKKLSPAELEKNAKKTVYWKKPDYKGMLEKGIPEEAVYAQWKIRSLIKPNRTSDLEKESANNQKSGVTRLSDIDISKEKAIRNRNYIEMVVKLRVAAERFTDLEKGPELADELKSRLTITGEKHMLVSEKYREFLKEGMLDFIKDLYDTENTLFLHLQDDTEKFTEAVNGRESNRKPESKRKEEYVLKEINFYREGPELYGRSNYVVQNKMQEAFHIRGLQYGNSTDKEFRKQSFMRTFESLADMAGVLRIPAAEMGLHVDNRLIYKDEDKPDTYNGNLALAFGARGLGGATAHYERGQHVINLTAKNGAGSLAHEFGHALDFCIARAMMGPYTTEMATEAVLRPGSGIDFPELAELMEAIYTKTDGSKSEYLKNTEAVEKRYRTMRGDGYWSSPCEMFARAFACYIKDRLEAKGIENLYLTGHAEYETNNPNQVRPVPQGDERTLLNMHFDSVMEALKERGLFHEQEMDYAKLKDSLYPHFSMDDISPADYNLIFEAQPLLSEELLDEMGVEKDENFGKKTVTRKYEPQIEEQSLLDFDDYDYEM